MYLLCILRTCTNVPTHSLVCALARLGQRAGRHFLELSGHRARHEVESATVETSPAGENSRLLG